MKITWLVNQINQVGGIEQVVCGLSNYFSGVLNYDVEIISINSFEGKPYFQLHEAVRIRHGKIDYRTETTEILRRFISNTLAELDSDYLITCHPAISLHSILLKHRYRGKVIVTQHCAWEHFTVKRRLLNALMFRFADELIVLTKSDQRFYQHALCRATVIPNAIFADVDKKTELTCPMLVAVGRITAVKGFDMLIDAFAQIAHDYPDWRLCICGDGEDLDTLKKQAKKYGLEERILFPGFVRVSEYMSKSSGFVLSSRNEGFSLVLLEAMAHGLPVVAFELPPVKEICNGRGVLTAPRENVPLLAQRMAELMASEKLRRALSEEAFAVSQLYTVQSVAKLWEDLFRRGQKT